MSFTITNQTVLEAIRQAALAKNWQQAYQLVIDAITVTIYTLEEKGTLPFI
jgi:hypothetical protein